MKRAIGNGITALALLAMAAAFGYFFYTELNSAPWKTLGLPASLIALAVGGLVSYFALNDVGRQSAPDLQLQVRPPAPKPEPPAIQTAFMTFGMVFMVLFGLYWRHTFYPSEKTLPIDTWWPVVLPAATGLAAMAWLADTLFLPIINGSHSGRSPAALRAALIVKRLAVTAVVFTALCGLGLWHLADV